MRSYKDLYVWTASVEMAVDVVNLTTGFPWAQRRVLTEQMQRSAVSVPSNVAEGKGRLSDRELRRFLGVARGSLFELDTQIEIASRVGLLDVQQCARLQDRIARIGAGLNNLINRTKE